MGAHGMSRCVTSATSRRRRQESVHRCRGVKNRGRRMRRRGLPRWQTTGLSARSRIARARKVFPAASMGATHALRGWPRKVTQGLRAARTAKRNGFTAALNLCADSCLSTRLLALTVMLRNRSTYHHIRSTTQDRRSRSRCSSASRSRSSSASSSDAPSNESASITDSRSADSKYPWISARVRDNVSSRRTPAARPEIPHPTLPCGKMS
jgi:hypothetical protein